MANQMRSVLEELQQKRAAALEMLPKWRKEAAESTAIADQIEKKIADLDRAIAALTPAPAQEGEVPDGFTKWDAEAMSLPGDTRIQYMLDDGHFDATTIAELAADVERGFAELSVIIAYRVLPTQPASEAPHAEGYAHVVEEPREDDDTPSIPEAFSTLSQSNPCPASIGAAETHADESDAVKGEHPEASFWARALTQKVEA